MYLDRVDIAGDHAHRAVDAELREEEGDLSPLRGQDLVLLRQLPELSLERPQCLFPSRVDELLVGLVRLSLVCGIGEAPRLDLTVEAGRERGMLVQRVLESRGQVDLGRLDGREAVEELVRQRRRAVL